MDNLSLKVENIVAEEKIALFELFLLLSLCFQKAVCCRGVRKHLYVGKGYLKTHWSMNLTLLYFGDWSFNILLLLGYFLECSGVGLHNKTGGLYNYSRRTCIQPSSERMVPTEVCMSPRSISVHRNTSYYLFCYRFQK